MRRTVKELISGYWMMQIKSREDAIHWFSRCPAFVGELEIRQLFDAADFEPVIKTEVACAAMASE